MGEDRAALPANQPGPERKDDLVLHRRAHYAGGAAILFILLMAALGVWYWSAGSVSVDTFTSLKVEMFYWGAKALRARQGQCTRYQFA